jgi:YqaJ-like viral recombinase domain
MMGPVSKLLPNRRSYIGGSDARIIMGQDEKALIRLWQEKRGDVEPEDLSANLIVQLGLVTEDLNRQWYERNTGRAITDVQSRIKQSVDMAGTRARVDDPHAFLRLRNRTPAPPPFSSINSTPAASSASCSFARASTDTRGPKPPSKRLTVGSESPARVASSV